MGYTLHYYDLVLACIAASLSLGAGIGYVTSVPLEPALAVFGVIAIGLIGHALFVNGPVDEPEDLTDELEVEEVPQVLSPMGSAE
ncbi:hypothetical protein [Natronorubrum sulfidifaciens]|uniref:Uncharacterized protein n=1 Tax=Natronorubrum sulfidifaciens JCM 14089 TaxID=1230460 RepID=L9W8J1_9EURY|nr:hypothetical protein [Natronorubrum sulfidifaciens]ELY45657.1 hypothetical protein C495_07750 [Natronorubrum sulfidifaciens JCM 14089]